jgi:hypothetical protein
LPAPVPCQRWLSGQPYVRHNFSRRRCHDPSFQQQWEILFRGAKLTNISKPSSPLIRSRVAA